MKHKITDKPENLIIEVTEIKNNKNKVLEGFQKCQEGNCECSTSEYEKVDKIDISTTNDSVTINIKPKKVRGLIWKLSRIVWIILKEKQMKLSKKVIEMGWQTQDPFNDMCRFYYIDYSKEIILKVNINLK